jgi:hypothetical protein
MLTLTLMTVFVCLLLLSQYAGAPHHAVRHGWLVLLLTLMAVFVCNCRGAQVPPTMRFVMDGKMLE